MINLYIFLIVGVVIFHKFFIEIAIMIYLMIYLMIKYKTTSLVKIEKMLKEELIILKLKM